jgi:maltose O-acetyltransferase
MQIKKGTIIYGGCEFRSPWNIQIGESVIGANSILDGRGGIIIGDHVCTSSQINIWTMQHDSQDGFLGVNTGTVIIEDYAWVSSKSTLLPGRIVGRGAVVANSEVVTKNCEAFGIYAGVPAHKIGNRNTNVDYDLDTHWWFM